LKTVPVLIKEFSSWRSFSKQDTYAQPVQLFHHDKTERVQRTLQHH
jgi:hypothetical protein